MPMPSGYIHFIIVCSICSGRLFLFIMLVFIQMQKKAHGFLVVDGTMISGEESCPLRHGLMKSLLIIL